MNFPTWRILWDVIMCLNDIGWPCDKIFFLCIEKKNNNNRKEIACKGGSGGKGNGAVGEKSG